MSYVIRRWGFRSVSEEIVVQRLGRNLDPPDHPPPGVDHERARALVRRERAVEVPLGQQPEALHVRAEELIQ